MTDIIAMYVRSKVTLTCMYIINVTIVYRSAEQLYCESFDWYLPSAMIQFPDACHRSLRNGEGVVYSFCVQYLLHLPCAASSLGYLEGIVLQDHRDNVALACQLLPGA